jgi:hypothetical protein
MSQAILRAALWCSRARPAIDEAPARARHAAATQNRAIGALNKG